MNKILPLGLAAIIAACYACNKQDNNDFIRAIKGERRTYAQEMIVSSSKGNMLIYDLDGDNKADEAFFIPSSDDPYLMSYKALTHGNAWKCKWKHQVAEGERKPLVINNITPMSETERELYSGMMNIMGMR